MKTAILLIEFPYGPGDGKAEEQKTWRRLADERDKKAAQSKGIQKIHEAVWLIDVQTGLHFLSWCIVSAAANGVKCQVAFTDETLNWIDPKSDT